MPQLPLGDFLSPPYKSLGREVSIIFPCACHVETRTLLELSTYAIVLLQKTGVHLVVLLLKLGLSSDNTITIMFYSYCVPGIVLSTAYIIIISFNSHINPIKQVVRVSI